MRFLPHIILCLLLSGLTIGYSQTWDELNNLSKTAFSNGDYSLAISYGEKALKLALKESGKQSTNYAASLSNLGFYYKNKGEFEKAEAHLLEALAIREKLVGKISSDYAITLNGLGKLYDDMGKYEKAEECMLECLEIGKKMNGTMTVPYAQFLNNITLLYKTMGRNEEALKYCQEALVVLKQNYGETHKFYATCLNNLGSIYDETGNYIEARNTYLKVLDIQKKLNSENSLEYGITLGNIAEIYDKLGDNSKAEECYIQSKSIIENKLGKVHPTYAFCINNMGLFYLSEGRYKEAESYMLEAMQVRKVFFGEDHPDYASSLNSLGSFYYEMNNMVKAEEYYLEAFNIRKNLFGEKHSAYVVSLNNLAILYKDLGQLNDAKTLFSKALQINIDLFGEDHYNVASSLNNLAETYYKLKDYKNSEQYYLKALKIKEKLFGKESEEVAGTLINIAKVYAATGSVTVAKEYTLKALDIKKKKYGEEHPNYKDAVNHLMGLYLKTDDLAKAMPLLSVCVGNFTNDVGELSSFLSEDELQQYMTDETASLDVYHSMVWRSNNSFPQANTIVLDMSLFVRGIQLRSSESLKKDIFNNNDTSLVSSYTEWVNYKSQIAHQLTLPVESRSKDLADWLSVANSLEKNLVKGSGVFKTDQGTLNLEWKKVRQRLLPDEAAIEFVSFQYYDGTQWTDSVFYFAMVVRPTDSIPSYTRLFEEKQLSGILSGDSLRTFANLLYTDAQIRFVKHDISYGDSLFQLVWKPLTSRLNGVKKIYFSPAGLLHNISFDAVPGKDQHLLSDSYQLQRLTSIGKITEEKEIATGVNSIALYGGLDYNTDTTQLKNLAKNDQYLASANSSRSVLDSTNRGGSWIYLPGTEKELVSIQEIFVKNKLSAKTYSHQMGTEESVKLLDGAKSPSVLHLSTHGFFFPDPKLRKGDLDARDKNVFQVADNPLLRSGLIMSGANYVWKGGKPADGIEDGILTAYEVSNLYLPNTRLVVMSACETGLGDIKGSEGVYGLQRAFKMAGVDYIIVTLWQVLDKETSEFMILFYQNLLNQKSIPLAFKTTQDTMKNKYREEPYKWAGFVLIN